MSTGRPQSANCPTNPCYGGRDRKKAKPVRRYPIEEFNTALQASGATAVILVNMWSSGLQEQLAFLQHARAIGALPAGSYVELGGEFYWGKFSGRWATGGEYAATAVQWARAIKAQFSDVLLLAIACHSFEYGKGAPTYRGHTWNAEVYRLVSAPGSCVDGVTIHPYLHLDDDSVGGGVLQPGLPARQKGEIALRGLSQTHTGSENGRVECR